MLKIGLPLKSLVIDSVYFTVIVRVICYYWLVCLTFKPLTTTRHFMAFPVAYASHFMVRHNTTGKKKKRKMTHLYDRAMLNFAWQQWIVYTLDINSLEQRLKKRELKCVKMKDCLEYSVEFSLDVISTALLILVALNT